MTECPACLDTLVVLETDEGEVVACHMLLLHGTKKIREQLAPFGVEYMAGYMFCWCGHLMSADYPWHNADALQDAAEELAGHWATRGGVQAHYLAHCLGVDDAPGTDAV